MPGYSDLPQGVEGLSFFVQSLVIDSFIHRSLVQQHSSSRAAVDTAAVKQQQYCTAVDHLEEAVSVSYRIPQHLEFLAKIVL